MESDYLNRAHKCLQNGEIRLALFILEKGVREISYHKPEYKELLYLIKELNHISMRLYGSIYMGNRDQDETDVEMRKRKLVLSIYSVIEELERNGKNIEFPKSKPSLPVNIFHSVLYSVKKFLSKSSGKIVYESPSKMALNTDEFIIVRISRNSLKNAVLKEGLDAAKTKEGDLEISNVMEVVLFEIDGQQNFGIFPLNNTEQVLNKKSYTEWRYCISAKRVGKFSLILRVSMKIYLPELGERKKDIVTWSTSIKVDVDSEVQMENIQLENMKWTNDFKKGLKERIANNEFGSVFQDLANHLSIRDTELFNNLVILQTWFNNVSTSQLRGVISNENYLLNNNQVTQGLLNLIDEVGSPRTSEKLSIYKEEISKWARMTI